MCKRIGMNPQINAKHIKDPSSMAEVRNTLLVVAAFLAALSFAAGFTLPGGLNQNTGEANLAKKASFITFVLADAYAMCNAMFVMFCLMWSMVCDHDKSLILIDHSVVILMQSLYGTLVAFMTGVYTVIHKSIWASILIFVMCSVVAIAANKTILYFMLDKLFPSAEKRRNDQSRSRKKINSNQTRSLSQVCSCLPSFPKFLNFYWIGNAFRLESKYPSQVTLIFRVKSTKPCKFVELFGMSYSYESPNIELYKPEKSKHPMYLTKIKDDFYQL